MINGVLDEVGFYLFLVSVFFNSNCIAHLLDKELVK